MNQRTVLSSVHKTEIECEKTFDMLTVAFGESIMSKQQVQLWYNRYKEGREDVSENAHTGCLITAIFSRFGYGFFKNSTIIFG